MVLTKVNTFGGYDYYRGESEKGTIYNIVPQGSPAPSGGYYNKTYICAVKNLPDLF